MTRITSLVEVSNNLQFLNNDQLQIIDEVAFESLLEACVTDKLILRAIAMNFFADLQPEEKLRLISMDKPTVVENLGFNPYNSLK